MSFPMMPEIPRIGTKATIVLVMVTIIGAITSFTPVTTASIGLIPVLRFSNITSAMTMASSTIIPKTVIMAPILNIFRVMPELFMNISTISMLNGRLKAVQKEVRKSRKILRTTSIITKPIKALLITTCKSDCIELDSSLTTVRSNLVLNWALFSLRDLSILFTVEMMSAFSFLLMVRVTAFFLFTRTRTSSSSK